MVLVEMEEQEPFGVELEYFGVVNRNGVKILIISGPAYKMSFEIQINTLVDKGPFENVDNRSGHRFLLNGKELKILKSGYGDVYEEPEILFTSGDITLSRIIEDDEYEEVVAHLQVNVVAPIEGGRRRRATRRRRHR